MDLENYKEGKSMQQRPLFEANCFIYWKNRFETYVKCKDIDLWYIIVYSNYKPTVKDKDGKDIVITYEKFDENHKKMISKNDEYEKIFMCDVAKDIWNSLIITYQALDESFLSRNHVRKFLRALPTKWRPKVTAVEESKDLSTIPLDELIDNLKVYEAVLEKDLETSRNKKENYKSVALKEKKVLSEEESTSSDSNDEEYAMAVRDLKKFFRRKGKFVRQPHDDKRNFQKANEDKKEQDDQRCFKFGDPNHFISDCPKHSFNDQKAFVVGCWSDSEDDSKKEEICLMALDDNEERIVLKFPKLSQKPDNINTRIKRPAFKLLKGTRTNFVELEYDFEECYKALSEKLDWDNPEGGDSPFDLTKPIPLIMNKNHQIVPVDYFFNNDLKYL
nr:zf-CCHC domain-containing protein/DUF4219 domain-containing protein/UBN2 domain-containing protein [Tanacetum cinerariifolium]